MAKVSGIEDAGGWLEVLDQLSEAVIVLDRQRILRHVNHAARKLLGYEEGQPIGGRCRLTTRGVDCEHACPLTFALESGLEKVEGFSTIYRTVDGRAVPLEVTVVPFLADDGTFLGAVEILRPSDPRPGFFTCGVSKTAAEARDRAAELADASMDLVIVGEAPACRDVARTIHRFSGLPDGLFREWDGGWDGIAPWPPGTVFSFGAETYAEIEYDRPEGWRIIVGAAKFEGSLDSLHVWDLPPLAELESDLGQMIGTWVDELAPGTSVSASALEQIVSMAGSSGLDGVEKVLTTAVAAAGGCVDTVHLPIDGHRTVLVDELMKTENPLAALEERVLREVLESCDWRMQDAAERLGISRVTLWRKMKDRGIDRP